MPDYLRDTEDIDWNQVWRKNTIFPYSQEDWNDRVTSFSERSIDSKYASIFINFLQPQSQWTVFDMGCGSGTLALPLAALVKTVTAADFSPKMLAALEQYARERKIENITPLKLSWLDDWDMISPKSHDIAIASRSMLVGDFRGAVEKLIRVAEHRVYLALPVAPPPQYDLAYQGLGRKNRRNPDYSCCYNILYQMGIRANITILKYFTSTLYGSPDEAISSLMERYENNLDANDAETLRKYINSQLIRDNAKWRLKTPTLYQCAVIWWEVTW